MLTLLLSEKPSFDSYVGLDLHIVTWSTRSFSKRMDDIAQPNPISVLSKLLEACRLNGVAIWVQLYGHGLA